MKKAFPRLLLEWFRENGRSYAWREKRDPYEIIIAEIMLQRTRADQVEPVYLEFIKRFPNALELKRATEEDIAEYFDRLGLLWRANRVKRLAEELVGRYGGRVPESRDLLISLPAVGEYIADAVLCFAFGEDVAVVDANVCRIIERVFGIAPKGEARRDRRFRTLAQEMIVPGMADRLNWAMIDLAALVCTSRSPSHDVCPMNKNCLYYQKLQLAENNVVASKEYES